MNRFDPIEHKYYMDEEEVLTNTEILKGIGAMNDFWYDASGRERGISIHAVCNAIIRGESYDPNPDHKGYYEAFARFLWETGFVPDVPWCEKPLFCADPYGKFGCTPDMPGAYCGDSAIVDIKTGEPGYAVKLQLAGQGIALNANQWWPGKNGLVSRRFSLRLRESGIFKRDRDFIEYKNGNDYTLFRNALALMTDRRNYEKEKRNGTSKTQESS